MPTPHPPTHRRCLLHRGVAEGCEAGRSELPRVLCAYITHMGPAQHVAAFRLGTTGMKRTGAHTPAVPPATQLSTTQAAGSIYDPCMWSGGGACFTANSFGGGPSMFWARSVQNWREGKGEPGAAGASRRQAPLWCAVPARPAARQQSSKPSTQPSVFKGGAPPRPTRSAPVASSHPGRRYTATSGSQQLLQPAVLEGWQQQIS